MLHPVIAFAILLGILWVLTQTEFGRKVFAVIGILIFVSMVILGVSAIHQETQFAAANAEIPRSEDHTHPPPGETRAQMLARCEQYHGDVVDMILNACTN